jgi:uncharacterized membrane protein
VPDDYEVGYGRPPRHSRFQKGKSGNPKGRPKGGRNFASELQEALDQTVLVREDGNLRRVSRRGAVVLSLVAKALKGDVRAASLLLQAEQRSEASRQPATDDALSADEAAVLDGLKARLREQLHQQAKQKDADPER